MDVSLLIKQRLNELGLDQKGLAAAAQVTESYVSQLLARKKLPPSPQKTEIYDRIGEFLGLPAGELTKLADLQRQEEMKKKVADPPEPLHQASRDLLVRTCEPIRRREIRRIFEKEPFGELERLITQKLLEVAQGMAKEGLHQPDRSGDERFQAQMPELLETDVFNASVENCIALLEAAIRSWDMDLKTFALEVLLHPSGAAKHFEFVEREKDPSLGVEPGFEQFLHDEVLSAGVTEEEIEHLKAFRFKGKRPAAIFYYRALQNLRDPVHFARDTNPA